MMGRTLPATVFSQFEMDYIALYKNNGSCWAYTTCSLGSSRVLCHSIFSSLQPIFMSGDLILADQEINIIGQECKPVRFGSWPTGMSRSRVYNVSKMLMEYICRRSQSE